MSYKPYDPRDLIEFTARRMRIRNWAWLFLALCLVADRPGDEFDRDEFNAIIKAEAARRAECNVRLVAMPQGDN